MVIVDLPVPPGFTVDAGEFAESVGAKRVQKFSVTARQVTLYLGDVGPGSAQAFEYTLRPKYPIKAKAPARRWPQLRYPGRGAGISLSRTR
jgi:hypothetical protein